MTQTYENYIDGEWTGSGETQEVTNPADETDVVSTVPVASAADADEAVAAAAAATDEWGEMPGPERGASCARPVTLLPSGRTNCGDSHPRGGEAAGEAAGEVQRAIDIFHYFSSKAADLGGTKKGAAGPNTNLYTRQEPVGVAALITPWNYPIAIPAWKLAPALAAGNTVVLKPAMQAPTVGAMIVEALDEAGIPDGAIDLVCGPGSEVGEQRRPRRCRRGVVHGQCFGRRARLRAGHEPASASRPNSAGRTRRSSRSADPAEAADIVAAGGFGSTGQSCTRLPGHRPRGRVRRVPRRLVDHAESLEIGDGLDRAGWARTSARRARAEPEYIDVAQPRERPSNTPGDERAQWGVRRRELHLAGRLLRR